LLGNIITLGQHNVFKFHHPVEAKHLDLSTPKEKRKHNVFQYDTGCSNDELLSQERKKFEELFQAQAQAQAGKEALEEQKQQCTQLVQEHGKQLGKQLMQLTEQV
jgi:hypothetical protein